MTNYDPDSLEYQRQHSMDSWLKAREEAGRILAEQGKRTDWPTWAETQLKGHRYESMLRRILGDHLPKPKPVVLI